MACALRHPHSRIQEGSGLPIPASVPRRSRPSRGRAQDARSGEDARLPTGALRRAAQRVGNPVRLQLENVMSDFNTT